jgi:hypothetical protein
MLCLSVLGGWLTASCVTCMLFNMAVTSNQLRGERLRRHSARRGAIPARSALRNDIQHSRYVDFSQY